MLPHAYGLRRGLIKFSSNVKRERATRDRCQQIIMQQIMVQVLFMAEELASTVQHVHHFDDGIEIAGCGFHPDQPVKPRRQLRSANAIWGL